MRASADGLTLLNFLSNHDVIRLASVLDQPQHYTLATASLMLLPGIPCFYYGDEFGVEVRPVGTLPRRALGHRQPCKRQCQPCKYHMPSRHCRLRTSRLG